MAFFYVCFFHFRIEKSRTILPTLKDALTGPQASSVNLNYFYDLLFTHKKLGVEGAMGNLKLVHVVCHVKKPHELDCDPAKVFRCNGNNVSTDVVDESHFKECSLPTRNTRQKPKVLLQVNTRLKAKLKANNRLKMNTRLKTGRDELDHRPVKKARLVKLSLRK